MTVFARFIPSNTVLNPAAVRAAGLAAAPFPETAGRDEILKIGTLADAQQAEMWAYGHAQAPRYFAPAHLDTVAETAFREGHDNILMVYPNPHILLWLPAEHEFFVVCAPSPLLQQIQADALFGYDFSAYLAEPYFRDKTKSFLQAILRDYTIASAH